MSPLQRTTQAFAAAFGARPVLSVRAPGRVNLIGEHTDYNDGYVLPVAINFHTAVAAGARSDRLLDVIAHDEKDSRVQISLDEDAQHDSSATWSNYVRGVVKELRARGYRLRGANLAISGNVPMGAGLSSSAALEIATAVALTRLSGEPLDARTAAKIGQSAENDFVGVNCGIMDQLISAAGQSEHAIMLDCRSLELEPVRIPAGVSIVVIDSKVQRRLVDGEYNDRRQQCEAAARHFGLDALRDLTLTELENNGSLLDEITYRRARHVVTENQRTLDMVEALRRNDTSQISSLMAQSHASMRDDFAITVPQIDKLVDIVSSVVGDRGGVRMTGGGFGGCIVALLPDALVEGVLSKVAHDYPAFAGHDAVAFVCQASDGAFATREQ
jgi:galactokinase